MELNHQVNIFLNSFSSPNTRRSYRRDLESYLNFCKDRDPFAMTTLLDFQTKLRRKMSSSTVARTLSTAKSFAKFLTSSGALTSNQLEAVRAPKITTEASTQAFDDAEVLKMITAGYEDSRIVGRAVMILLFHLGLRRSELCNLKVKDFKSERGIRFVEILGKGDKIRLIPLSDVVAREIDLYLKSYEEITLIPLKDSNFLFPRSQHDRNEPMSTGRIYRMVKRCAKLAGVTKRVSPHSCRATLISSLLEKNVSPRSVADLVGHSSINTTVGIYDRKRDLLTNPAARQVSFEESA